MDLETRNRTIARQRRKRRRQRKRRIFLVGCFLFLGMVVLAVRGLSALRAKTDEWSEILPEQYDLRENGKKILVPDQGSFGTCWAFAALKALETSMPDSPLTFSADHMSIRNSFGLGQEEGGDYSISTAYLLAWQGPVTEEEDPYGDGISPEGLEAVCHVQEIQILGNKDYEAVRKSVYRNGGVQSSFYMPQSDEEERSQYYNAETCSFYYDGEQEANHDIVIIGWDDHYPKENFVISPEQDGAFLCMNTWGERFGNAGFFYISYEDSRIGENCVAYTKVEEKKNYDILYQSDLCGWTGQMGYGISKAWFANVYEADMEINLEAAGFYATAPETEYRIYAASAGAYGEDIKWEPHLMAEGKVSNAGYYTIPWKKPFFAESGERFAVIIEIDSPQTTEPVAIEYCSDSRRSQVDIEDGEGYISFDGVNWERTETNYECNVCLKVYANIKE